MLWNWYYFHFELASLTLEALVKMAVAVSSCSCLSSVLSSSVQFRYSISSHSYSYLLTPNRPIASLTSRASVFNHKRTDSNPPQSNRQVSKPYSILAFLPLLSLFYLTCWESLLLLNYELKQSSDKMKLKMIQDAMRLLASALTSAYV